MPRGGAAKKIAHPYISLLPKNGQESPVIKGTRIKVTDIALRYDLMGMTPDQIVEQFPHLTLSQVHDALSYYYEHKVQLDRQHRKDQTMIAELKRHYSSKLKAKLQ